MTQPSDPDLEGVRALVTGGTSGLGFAMSRALAMGPPICWLASRASDGLTDQRIVAKDFADHVIPQNDALGGSAGYRRCCG